MSMIMCTRCDFLIDSDDDPDCFIHIDDKPTEHVWCEACREELDAEQEDEDSNHLAPMSERAGIF